MFEPPTNAFYFQRPDLTGLAAAGITSFNISGNYRATGLDLSKSSQQVPVPAQFVIAALVY